VSHTTPVTIRICTGLAWLVLSLSALALVALAFLMGIGYCNEDIALDDAASCHDVALTRIGTLAVGVASLVAGAAAIRWGRRRTSTPLVGAGAALAAAGTYAAWFWLGKSA
jgi:hypothetical protein